MRAIDLASVPVVDVIDRTVWYKYSHLAETDTVPVALTISKRCWLACRNCEEQATAAIYEQDGFVGYFCRSCRDAMPAWYKATTMERTIVS